MKGCKSKNTNGSESPQCHKELSSLLGRDYFLEMREEKHILCFVSRTSIKIKRFYTEAFLRLCTKMINIVTGGSQMCARLRKK
jgi:uncharacterized CHY-type Zn-finger protein